MGITIFFKGKLNHPDLTNNFLAEMADIAQAMEWDYKSQNYNDKLLEVMINGLIIIPHKDSEPLSLLIDKEGYFRNGIMLRFAPEKPQYTYVNFIKTQFAPIEIHIALVKLFKYIKKKYVSNLEIIDEGDYWETGNAELLKQKFDFINFKIRELEAALSSVIIKEGESPESIADKIEQILSAKQTKGIPPESE